MTWLVHLIWVVLGMMFYWTASAEPPPPTTTTPHVEYVEPYDPYEDEFNQPNIDDNPGKPDAEMPVEVCIAVYPRPIECGPPYDEVPVVTIEPWEMEDASK